MERVIPIKEYNGEIYHNIITIPHKNGVVTFNDIKYILPGFFRISLITNSEKYKSEVQFRIFSKDKPREKERLKSGRNWNVVEICLDGREAIKVFEEVLVYLKRKEAEIEKSY